MLRNSCSTSFPSFLVEVHLVASSSGQPNYLSTRLPLPSRLNVWMWRDLLLDYSDNIICEFLGFGWSLGYCGEAIPVFDLRNDREAFNLSYTY